MSSSTNEYPKIQQSVFTERAGLFAIGAQVNELGLIFRETPNSDVGIDAQIEFVSEGTAIGKLIAVQAKSGKSYLNDRGDHFAFYPDEKHKTYWECFPLPVLIMLHDPESGNVYYSDARYYLSIPERERKFSYIPVFKNQVLKTSTKEQLFNTPSINTNSFMDFSDLLAYMVNTEHKDAAFPVSYFEIFVQTLTNLCRHSFFNMDVLCYVAATKLIERDSYHGVGVGPETHDYLHGYVKFLIEQNLVQVDYSDYLIDWNEREMQPKFLSPLTSRGRKFLTYISQVEEKLFSNDEFEVAVVCERFVQMTYTFSDIQRFQKISLFSQRFKKIS